MQRPFTSGSRQAPDPHDNFLEEIGYYRKHTARDSSCLFRVISEQMYDTQNHHLSIRQKCVNYMRNNRDHYQYEVEIDIDDYLDELSKMKTSGTLLELQAMAYMYRRNVVLFRPMDQGTWLICDENFKDIFQIFISHDKHFDTVYTNEFIQDAAFCQSLCYEILYKQVFNLPDVTYAVERMLHASSFENIAIQSEYDGFYCRRMQCDDGRCFDFEPPETTSCILNNSDLCHFHNPNFLKFTENLNNEIDNDSYDKNHHQIVPYGHGHLNNNNINRNGVLMNEQRLRTMDSLLPEKYISCVRQLLSECITPFPYKVAKALDPDMYRNIEFDSWSEMRKEIRFKNWYTGGNALQNIKSSSTRQFIYNLMDKQSTSPLQVGVKCQVYLQKSDEIFTGYIQEMSGETGPCIVFIEQLGEKQVVQFDSLKPLPLDQMTPMPLPYRLQKHLEKYSNNSTKNFKRYSHAKYKVVEYETYEMQSYPCEHHHYDLTNNVKDNIEFKLKQYCSLDNFTPPAPCEIITMPLTVEHNNRVNSNRSSSTPRLSITNVSDSTTNGDDENNINLKRSDSSVSNSLETLVDENVEYDLQNQQHQHNQQIHNGVISCTGLMGEPQYAYGYTEPCYSYQYADNSIMHTTAGPHGILPNPGAQYYCVYPTQTGATTPTGGYQQAGPNGLQHGIYMQPAPQAIHGYYQTPLPYYATTLPAAAMGQIQACGGSSVGSVTSCTAQSSGQNNNLARGQGNYLSGNTNINYAVQKSTQDNGSDLPNDVATLQYFFNLGLDYYNRENDKDVSKLSSDFHKNIKLENESTNQSKHDLSNNNIAVNSNNSNVNHHVNNNSDRGGHNNNKRFNMRYFNNRKGQNSYRGGNNNGNNQHHRFSSSTFSGGNNNNNKNNHNHLRNNNNNEYGRNVSGQNKSNNNPNTSGERSNNNSRNSANDQNNQTSPVLTANEYNEYVQTPLNGATPVTTFVEGDNNNNTEHQQYPGQNSYVGNNVGGGNGNGVYVPHIMPMPFGICTTPVTNTSVGPTTPHPIVTHNNSNGTTPNGMNGNYQYITTGLPPPNHPPPPLPQMPPSNMAIPATSYPQPPPPHPGSYYYATTTNNEQQSFVTTPGAGDDIGGGGGVMIGTAVGQQQYPIMNYPIYYSPSNGTPLAGIGGGVPTPTNNATPYHQGYWYSTAAPLPPPPPQQQQQPPPVPRPQSQNNLTPTTTSSQSSGGGGGGGAKMNYSGNSSNVSH